MQEPVFVEVAYIPGMEPAVLDTLRRRAGIVKISLHHTGAGGQDLAVVRDLDADP